MSDDLSEVFRGRDLEARLVAGRLESEGIACRIWRCQPPNFVIGALGPAADQSMAWEAVSVAANDQQRAQQIIGQGSAATPTLGGPAGWRRRLGILMIAVAALASMASYLFWLWID